MTYSKRRNRQARQRKLNRSLWNHEGKGMSGNKRTLVHYRGLGQRPTLNSAAKKKWFSSLS